MISKLTRAAAIGLGALVVPVGISVAGAAPASAGPDVCVSGPFGYAYACVDTPGWGRWDDGPRWRGHGHGHGWDD
ncbi:MULTISPECIES: hypothetical protein [unclassified Mycolicibacterium]|uniref:hypothetical protein n=1 Tax=unclassified Mycolicibacterium TaxID=2636767 RepID=UPI002ED78EFC